jgi:hypothetical protein
MLSGHEANFLYITTGIYARGNFYCAGSGSNGNNAFFLSKIQVIGTGRVSDGNCRHGNNGEKQNNFSHK